MFSGHRGLLLDSCSMGLCVKEGRGLLAAGQGHEQVVQQLLEAGVRVDAEMSQLVTALNVTPIDLAARLGSTH